MKLVINSDLDAIVCAFLLKDRIPYDNIVFVNPSDAQNGNTSIEGDFIAANIPYIKGARYWFDHHKSNIKSFQEKHPGTEVDGRRELADSCARVIANHFNIRDLDELLREIDRVDSAKFTEADIRNPCGYYLLSYLISQDVHDPKEMDFNRHLLSLIGRPISEILDDTQVREKIRKYQEIKDRVRDYIREHTKVSGNLIVVDLKEAPGEFIHPAFKFEHYPMYPESNVSIRIYHPGNDRSKTRFEVGYNPLNKGCEVDIGDLLRRQGDEYGGGGHKPAGGLTVPSEKADEILPQLIEALTN